MYIRPALCSGWQGLIIVSRGVIIGIRPLHNQNLYLLFFASYHLEWCLCIIVLGRQDKHVGSISARFVLRSWFSLREGAGSFFFLLYIVWLLLSFDRGLSYYT